MSKNEDIKKIIQDFIKENSGLIFSSEEIEVLSDPQEEVESILNAQMVPYIESHGGKLSILGVDEGKGIVLVELSGACTSGCTSSAATMEYGIKNTLKKLLYWVKKVEQPGDIKEMDLGISEVFKIAEKKVQDKEGE